jgi:hypothetical protein
MVNKIRLLSLASMISFTIQASWMGSSEAKRLAFDSAGNLYIADLYNHAIRKVSPDGTITTVAGSSTAPTGKR